MTSSTLSLQLYTVRNAISEDLRAALERVAALGLRQVELYGFVDRADEYAALLPELGLTAPSAHVDLFRTTEPAAAFAAARTIGIPTVIVPFSPPERWTSREEVEAVADQLNALVEPARDSGLEVGYHNHWWEFEDLGGTPALEVLADRLDPAVVLELDTYWTAVAGLDPIAVLGRLGDRVRFLHVKDGPANRETREQVPAGQGTLDVPGILSAAPRALRVIEFDDYADDVFDGIRGSIDFLVGKGESL
ncbi:sugar phosphate isomerase/epimerase [Naasia sp. SYSU D00948]|uniref:sugar phosphate isomerase/epimerase family protein n=1 Tax=Naasia sp. SYSU D00948 TaxID=2817379 RepID=UPI001B30DFBB|nr:sugar phosphate isomerase/epimerase [Naasia sp. SYSU D00948]